MVCLLTEQASTPGFRHTNRQPLRATQFRPTVEEDRMTPRPLLLVGGGGLAREVLATVRLLPDEWKTMERWMTTRASTVPILTACLFSAVLN